MGCFTIVQNVVQLHYLTIKRLQISTKNRFFIRDFKIFCISIMTDKGKICHQISNWLNPVFALYFEGNLSNITISNSWKMYVPKIVDV